MPRFKVMMGNELFKTEGVIEYSDNSSGSVDIIELMKVSNEEYKIMLVQASQTSKRLMSQGELIASWSVINKYAYTSGTCERWENWTRRSNPPVRRARSFRTDDGTPSKGLVTATCPVIREIGVWYDFPGNVERPRAKKNVQKNWQKKGKEVSGRGYNYQIKPVLKHLHSGRIHAAFKDKKVNVHNSD